LKLSKGGKVSVLKRVGPLRGNVGRKDKKGGGGREDGHDKGESQGTKGNKSLIVVGGRRERDGKENRLARNT